MGRVLAEVDADVMAGGVFHLGGFRPVASVPLDNVREVRVGDGDGRDLGVYDAGLKVGVYQVPDLLARS